MENQNTQIIPPIQPKSKKWYQHKGILAIIILALICGSVVWAYFILNQPKNLIPIFTSSPRSQVTTDHKALTVARSFVPYTDPTEVWVDPDEANTLWFTTNAGVVKLNTDTQQQQYLTAPEYGIDYKPASMAKIGNYLYLTFWSGLSQLKRINLTDHSVKIYNQILPGRTFYTDGTLLWIHGPSGLAEFDTQTGTFKNFNSSVLDTVHNESINLDGGSDPEGPGFMTADAQNFWIHTNNGIAKYDKQSGLWEAWGNDTFQLANNSFIGSMESDGTHTFVETTNAIFQYNYATDSWTKVYNNQTGGLAYLNGKLYILGQNQAFALNLGNNSIQQLPIKQPWYMYKDVLNDRIIFQTPTNFVLYYPANNTEKTVSWEKPSLSQGLFDLLTVGDGKIFMDNSNVGITDTHIYTSSLTVATDTVQSLDLGQQFYAFPKIIGNNLILIEPGFQGGLDAGYDSEIFVISLDKFTLIQKYDTGGDYDVYIGNNLSDVYIDNSGSVQQYDANANTVKPSNLSTTYLQQNFTEIAADSGQEPGSLDDLDKSVTGTYQVQISSDDALTIHNSLTGKTTLLTEADGLVSDEVEKAFIQGQYLVAQHPVGIFVYRINLDGF